MTHAPDEGKTPREEGAESPRQAEGDEKEGPRQAERSETESPRQAERGDTESPRQAERSEKEGPRQAERSEKEGPRQAERSDTEGPRQAEPGEAGETGVSGEPENPLLAIDFRIPFHRIRAEHVAPGIRELLERAGEEVEALVREADPPDYANTIERLDRITERVSRGIAPARHLLSVAESPPLREAYNQVLPEITQFWSRLALNQPLWRAVKAVAESPEGRALTGIRRRHLDKTILEFRRSGADLPPESRDALEAMRVELSRLSQKFSENVLDATAGFELHVGGEEKERVRGIPERALARARAAAKEKEQDGWIFTLDFPSFEAVVKHAEDRALREEIYRAYMGRCRGDAFDNREILLRILEIRHRLAVTLGYEDFPDYRLEDHMARTGARAAAFVDELEGHTRPYWERDVEELRRHAIELGLDELMPWDVSYVSESLRKRRYAIDDETLRPWFPLDSVLAGLFEVVRRVFGLVVTEGTVEEVWHPDVRYYEIRDEEGTFLGAFYTDWFPRKEKRQGAWMSDLITGGPRPDGDFRPHLGFIAGNFSPPSDGAPSLLTHREVETVFHEFGHLLHHCTSRVEIPARSGANVAWDWVELPSQIMENWTWEEEALALIARHHETGEPLPPELLERMRAARRFLGGSQQMRQLSFASLDLALHEEFAPSPGGDVFDFAEERLMPFAPAPVFARQHFLTSFTHIFAGGYAAGYYSYLWSQVLDADAFTRFREEGIFNRETGRAYVEAILTRGDSDDPEALFREFMGRDPDPGALVERNLGEPPTTPARAGAGAQS